MAALLVVQQQRRPRVAGQVLVAPAHDRDDRRIEVAAHRGQLVLVALGLLLVADLLEDPGARERLQARERMFRAMPRLRWISVKRRTPKKASRTIRKVQRSPRTSMARPIEQGSCCTMSPYRDGVPGLRRTQRRAARRALVRGSPPTTAELDLARAREGGFAGGFFAIFTPHPDGYTPGGARARAAGRSRVRGRPHVPRHAQAARPRARRPRCESRASRRTSCSTATSVAVMHIEGAEAVDAKLQLPPALHAFGLRSIGIYTPGLKRNRRVRLPLLAASSRCPDRIFSSTPSG